MALLCVYYNKCLLDGMFTYHVCNCSLSEVCNTFTEADDRLSEISQLFLSAGKHCLSIETDLLFS